jgi:hypothetical protein
VNILMAKNSDLSKEINTFRNEIEEINKDQSQ